MESPNIGRFNFYQKQAPQKGPLKNISPGAYFRNFTVGTVGTIYVPIHKYLPNGSECINNKEMYED